MEKRRRLHWAWVVLAICFVNLFVAYSVRLGYSVVLPEMIKSLGFSRTAGGSIYNSYLLTYVALTPFAGYLTDRFGGRVVISTCALVLGLGVFLMGTVETLWTSCIFYAVAGLGATGMWAPVITLVQKWFAPERRGLALGILSAGYGLGFATMGVAFPWVVAHFDWRFAWYFLGSMAVAMACANALSLRSNPESTGWRPWGVRNRLPDSPSTITVAKKRVALRTILRSRQFWIIGISYSAIAYSLYGITTFMVDYANHQLGLPLEKASLLATIHGIGQIVGVLTVLPLSDYIGRKKMILISNACITLALVGIVTLGKSWLILCILIACLAVFYGATFPIYGACAGDYFPTEAMGTVIGAWTPLYGIGAIGTHWVTGLLRDATGVYQHAFVIDAVLAAIGFFLISRVRKTPVIPP